MRLLLDTHIWLWAANRPDKLGHRLRRELQKPRNELFLSPVSIWEAHLLERRGRLRLAKRFEGWTEAIRAKVPVKEAPFTFPVGVEASRIALPQADPGDVFLAATAVVYDLTLVTSDEQLLSCSWLKTLANV